MVQEGSIFIQIYVSIHSIIMLIFLEKPTHLNPELTRCFEIPFFFCFSHFLTFAISCFMLKESILFISKFTLILELSQKCTYRNWTLSFPFSPLSIFNSTSFIVFSFQIDYSSSSFKNVILSNRM